MSRMDLEELGWDSFFAGGFREYEETGCVPGRVASADREVYVVWTEAGEARAGLAGRLRHDATTAADLPAVGDWVALAPTGGAIPIVGVLPRKAAFSRQLAGRATGEQLVAANVDTLFLVCGLDRDFNPRRIERSLILAWESGAAPVLLLNKADACADPEARAQAEDARSAAPGVPVHVVSGLAGTGLEALAPYLARGRTVALVGSSGVGKSTLINRLVGRDAQTTLEVRARDGRGRHATTRRELIRLPGGALLVDTPGWRELRLWADGSGLNQAFDDVSVLAARCRFRDCAHEREPGCAVRAGLPADRLASYHKLQAELGRLRSIHRLAKRFRPRG